MVPLSVTLLEIEKIKIVVLIVDMTMIDMIVDIRVQSLRVITSRPVSRGGGGAEAGISLAEGLGHGMGGFVEFG